jgi:CAAX protease family protein
MTKEQGQSPSTHPGSRRGQNCLKTLPISPYLGKMACESMVRQPISGTNLPERRRSPLSFFLMVFAMSAPFWLIGATSSWRLLPGVPTSAIQLICPSLAAVLLVYREDGVRAATDLVKRSLDYKRMTPTVWLLPIILLMPAAMLISYVTMRLLRVPLPTVEINWLSVAPLFLALFLAGLGEELGWSGYVIDPLQDRWGALGASLILGAVWAAWHVVPLQQVDRAAAWIAEWCFATVALRILHTWLYNNTGKSVFGQALFHASANTSWPLFPNNGSHYDPKITGIILAVTAVFVVLVFGPSRLTRETNS